MADLSEVSDTLVTMVADILFPNGSDAPSITGIDTRVFAGWPLTGDLYQDLAKGIANVNVYSRPEERNTTRFMDVEQTVSVQTPTLALTVAGQTITVGGQMPPASNPHHLAVFVNGKPYAYLVSNADSLTSIATAIARLISADLPSATSSGPIVLLPPNARIGAARMGVTGTTSREVGRREKLFQIGIWCNKPEDRSAIAKAIEPVLMDTPRFVLPDNYWARLIYKNSLESDSMEKQNLYRRDLFYTVEYPTTRAQTGYQITVIQENVTTVGSDTDPGRTFTVFE